MATAELERRNRRADVETLAAQVRAMTPDQREDYLVRAVAADPTLDIEALRTVQQKLIDGTYEEYEQGLERELEALRAESARLDRDIKQLQALAGIHVPSDKPWMMALEMQFAAMRVCDVLGTDRTMKPEARGLLAHLTRILKRAESYSWATDTANAVLLGSRSIPNDTVPTTSLLPGQAGWWWFSQPVPVRTTPEHDGVCALLWSTSERGLELASFVFGKYGPMNSVSWTWPHDVTVGDLVGGLGDSFMLIRPSDISVEEGHKAIEALSRFFLAGCAWLQQRVVVSSVGHVERHRRKQLARENDADVVSEIKVIELRRTERQSSPSGGGGDGEAREWSCRWIVSGHWRNQPYKNGERKLIYIMPFVKGPSDKPLKTATHTVYVVDR